MGMLVKIDFRICYMCKHKIGQSRSYKTKCGEFAHSGCLEHYVIQSKIKGDKAACKNCDEDLAEIVSSTYQPGIFAVNYLSRSYFEYQRTKDAMLEITYSSAHRKRNKYFDTLGNFCAFVVDSTYFFSAILAGFHLVQYRLDKVADDLTLLISIFLARIFVKKIHERCINTLPGKLKTTIQKKD